jgi:SAM-dependent methyltransferase
VPRVIRSLVLAAACLAVAAPSARAQLESINQPPVSGGKDVMWVPTPDAAVERMLSMAGVGARDLVYDLGSGDGKIAIMAARRFGARAVGVEYDTDMIVLSRAAAKKEGVADRVRFVQADIFDYDFREATVVTLYLLSTLNVKLRPKILEMKPGTRVASHMFRMGDWEPDEQARVASSDLFFWVVPAKVAGTDRDARPGRPFERLEQKYQHVSGSARVAGDPRSRKRCCSATDQFAFTAGGAVAFTSLRRPDRRRGWRGPVDRGQDARALKGVVRGRQCRHLNDIVIITAALMASSTRWRCA